MAEQPGYRGWPCRLYIDSAAQQAPLTMTRISDVGEKRDEVDLTHMESPDMCKEKLKGLRESGEFTAEFNAMPSDDAEGTLQTSLANDDWDTIYVEFPDEQIWSITGGITGYRIGGSVGEKLIGTLTVGTSGVWDYDASLPTA